MQILHRRTATRRPGGRAVLAMVLAAALGLAGFLGLIGCYPGGPEDFGDIGMVMTFKAPAGDFSGLHTYAMPDAVIPLINPDDDSSEPLDPQHDQLILTELASQLAARGFTRIDDPDTNNLPDVLVVPGAVQSDAYLVFTYWGYPGSWYPGWGWGYPGYPAYGAVKYTQGSVVWAMVDLRGVDAGGQDEAQVLWVSGLNGALTGQGTDPERDIPLGIAQAFDQSPYIKAAPAGK